MGSAPLTIGRSDDCDVVIHDPSVSRLHARLFVIAGTPIVEDAGSRHGLLVDGKQVAPGERAGAMHNARVTLGAHQLVVHDVARFGREAAPTVEMTRMKRQAPTVRDVARTGEVDPVVALMNDIEAASSGPNAVASENSIRALLVHLQNRHGGESDEPLVRRAASLVLRAATTQAQPSWVDAVVELHAGRSLLMYATAIDELEAALDELPTKRAASVSSYATKLRAQHERKPLSDDQRLCLVRLETLAAR